MRKQLMERNQHMQDSIRQRFNRFQRFQRFERQGRLTTYDI